MEKIVFLDRATLAPQIRLRRPSFAHDYAEHARTAPAEVVERLAGATIAILNKVHLDAAAIAQLPALRLVAVAATGTDCVDKAACVARGIAVNGEYYVSSVYQPMIEDGLRVITYPLRRFLQFGTPEDLEAVVRWSRYFEAKITPRKAVAAKRPLAGVVLMAHVFQRMANAG